MMRKAVVACLLAFVIGCGGSQAAVSKTTNPPRQTAKTPSPEKPPVEVDGKGGVKVNALKFQFTLPNDKWQGGLQQNDKGAFVVLVREDLKAMMMVQPLDTPGDSVESVAKQFRESIAKQAGATDTVSQIQSEAGGKRWAFTVEGGSGAEAFKGRFIVQEIAADRVLIGFLRAPAANYDAALADYVTLLDTVAPLD